MLIGHFCIQCEHRIKYFCDFAGIGAGMTMVRICPIQSTSDPVELLTGVEKFLIR